MEMPGVNAQDLTIESVGNRLVITARLRPMQHREDLPLLYAHFLGFILFGYRSERERGPYQRSV